MAKDQPANSVQGSSGAPDAIDRLPVGVCLRTINAEPNPTLVIRRQRSLSVRRNEVIGGGHDRSDRLVTRAKMLRLDLLKVKGDLERELVDFILNARGAASMLLGQRSPRFLRQLGAPKSPPLTLRLSENANKDRRLGTHRWDAPEYTPLQDLIRCGSSLHTTYGLDSKGL